MMVKIKELLNNFNKSCPNKISKEMRGAWWGYRDDCRVPLRSLHDCNFGCCSRSSDFSRTAAICGESRTRAADRAADPSGADGICGPLLVRQCQDRQEPLRRAKLFKRPGFAANV